MITKTIQIILLFFLFSCSHKIAHVSSKKTEKTNYEKETIFAHTSLSNTTEYHFEELNLSFSTIDSIEFNKHKVLYDSKIIQDSTKQKYSENGSYTFTIETNKANIKFVCGKHYERPCYNYIGFLEPLNASIIGQWGESVYDVFLVDKDDFSILSLIAEYDGGSGMPHISPLNSKLLTYSSVDLFTSETYYDSRSVISICTIENTKHLSDINTFLQFGTKDWQLIEMLWVDENSFVLKVCDEVKNHGFRNQTYINKRYLKAIID